MVSRPNLYGFNLSIHGLKARSEPVKMTYHKLKSIQIWPRNRAKHFRALLILVIIEPKRQFRVADHVFREIGDEDDTDVQNTFFYLRRSRQV